MNKNIEKSIRSIPIWNENIKIQTIEGGLTNQNFLIGSLPGALGRGWGEVPALPT